MQKRFSTKICPNKVATEDIIISGKSTYFWLITICMQLYKDWRAHIIMFGQPQMQREKQNTLKSVKGLLVFSCFLVLTWNSSLLMA